MKRGDDPQKQAREASKNWQSRTSPSSVVLKPVEYLHGPPRECVKCGEATVTSDLFPGEWRCECRSCRHQWAERIKQ